MEQGQRVRIIAGPWAGDCGTVEVAGRGILKVRLDSEHERGLALIQPSDIEEIQEEETDEKFD